MASVRLEQVSKRFPDGTRALEQIALEVLDGELLVVVGPSGCGKSTLLRIVAGLEEVSEGQVWIGDQVVNDWPPQQRNVAMVFQDYALYPFMTVRDNLSFPLRMRRLGRSEIAGRVERVARMLDLQPLLDRYPRELSGGQRQRVAMGRALVREPSVSLLDEPLSNLDAKLRVSVRAEIASIQERTRTTMIYVTHDQTEAMTLGHRVAVLDQGRLRQVAPPRELYDQPADAFVAGFIGNPPMNLFSARLVGAADKATLEFGAQRLRCSGSTCRVAPSAVPTPVIAGIRPEHLELRSGPGENVVAATVQHVEYLGHETLLYTTVDGTESVRWIARIPGMQPLLKGAGISLYAPPPRLYVFPAEPK